eukprot:TRINITY_DN3077_c0_g1_i2.p1 TRINITY_DN3077_c0_g1~~TRINITY_DN3077_c0_g1_i2.p1  ORF type:complete len:402 (+),score=115.29 TRINITY_DN3077_c0_g1_i2:34-1239(+)
MNRGGQKKSWFKAGSKRPKHTVFNYQSDLQNFTYAEALEKVQDDCLDKDFICPDGGIRLRNLNNFKLSDPISVESFFKTIVFDHSGTRPAIILNDIAFFMLLIPNSREIILNCEPLMTELDRLSEQAAEFGLRKYHHLLYKAIFDDEIPYYPGELIVDFQGQHSYEERFTAKGVLFNANNSKSFYVTVQPSAFQYQLYSEKIIKDSFLLRVAVGLMIKQNWPHHTSAWLRLTTVLDGMIFSFSADMVSSEVETTEMLPIQLSCKQFYMNSPFTASIKTEAVTEFKDKMIDLFDEFIAEHNLRIFIDDISGNQFVQVSVRPHQLVEEFVVNTNHPDKPHRDYWNLLVNVDLSSDLTFQNIVEATGLGTVHAIGLRFCEDNDGKRTVQVFGSEVFNAYSGASN